MKPRSAYNTEAFSTEFLQTIKELEHLNETYEAEANVGGYAGVWSAEPKVRLWSISRRLGEILRFFVLLQKPAVVLELGTSAGYSALWMASAVAEYADTAEYGGVIYTVEVAKPKISMAKQFFAKSKLSPHIVQLESDIKDVLLGLDEYTWIDFLFIDAQKDRYLEYLQLAEPHLSDGAMIIADNVVNFREETRAYQDYVLHSGAYFSQLLEIDTGFMVSVKK